jgi:alpha-ketoglutarate-dependent 2,4-dichlorophenoxyacetate dioxygenase
MIELTSQTRVYENTCPAGPLRLRGAAPEIKDGSLMIKPILTYSDSSFGAEVSGVDWSQPIPEDIVEQVINVRS